MENRPKTVLVIDDDEMVRESVRACLEHEGFQVAVVEEVAKVWDAIRAVEPDLVIMDMYMPETDGRVILREMKKNPDTAKIPVVFLTGSTEAVDVYTGLDAGAVEYFAKPFVGEDLAAKIRTILKMNAR